MTWEQYALSVAKVVSLKSKDPYVKVGCCLLRHDNTIASVGYNGFPSGIKEDWSDRDERRRYVNHAESNALRFVKPHECHLAAITLLPCGECIKSLVSYGIKNIVFEKIYEKDKSALELAGKFNVNLIQLESPIIILPNEVS